MGETKEARRRRNNRDAMRRWRERNREQARKADRERKQRLRREDAPYAQRVRERMRSPEAREYMRAYKKSPRQRELAKAAIERWRSKPENKQRQKAHGAVAYAIRRGILV